MKTEVKTCLKHARWTIVFFYGMLLAVSILTGCGQYDLSDKINSQPDRHVISLEDAKKELQDLLRDVDSGHTRSLEAGSRRIGTSYVISSKRATRSDSITPLIYIINFENNQGYAMMSADDRVPSLLCLVETGNISPTDSILNEGFMIFCDGLEEYYQRKLYGGKHDIGLDTGISEHPVINISDGPYRTYGPWENIVYKQNGYCPVKWNQENPYNNFCPQIQIKDKKALAGCVAIAVGQLMATHKYPSSYNKHLFNWIAMTRYPCADYLSQDAQNQVARLIQQLGTKII